ncbi:MAG: vWA domain-containing protein [Chloroherpetonaceae bacterium]|nr:vWA domain-containing protein [Chloroherpetonaceae bacterium]
MRKAFFTLLSTFFIIIFISSCDSLDSNGDDINSDIPQDPGGNLPQTTINNLRPSGIFERTANNERRIRISLIGLIDPVTAQPIELVGNSTVFVAENDVIKGLKVTKVGNDNTLASDLVFVVDNSGSMGQEADSIALKIIDFTNLLTSQGINLRVGCVGYSGNVTGAINLTNATGLESYLKRPSRTGTSRTVGFTGTDSARFQTTASTFSSGVGGENGIVGIRFADSLFSWRTGAQRIYINFTDEPTQPGSRPWFSTNGFLQSWQLNRGTIHTVWSNGDTTLFGTESASREKPWRLSNGTGGTIKWVSSNANGLNLTTLPVTGAVLNSYLIEFISTNPNDSNTVKIIVKNGTTSDGQSVFRVKY